VLKPKWFNVAFKEIQRLNVTGCVVPVVNWQALVLLKLYAGRPVDLQDARSVVAVRNPSAVERERLVAQAVALELGQEIRTLLDALPGS